MGRACVRVRFAALAGRLRLLLASPPLPQPRPRPRRRLRAGWAGLGSRRCAWHAHGAPPPAAAKKCTSKRAKSASCVNGARPRVHTDARCARVAPSPRSSTPPRPCHSTCSGWWGGWRRCAGGVAGLADGLAGEPGGSNSPKSVPGDPVGDAAASAAPFRPPDGLVWRRPRRAGVVVDGAGRGRGRKRESNVIHTRAVATGAKQRVRRKKTTQPSLPPTTALHRRPRLRPPRLLLRPR